MATFVGHALRQMQKRGITREEVEQVLSDHDTSYPSATPGRYTFVKVIGERRIAVIVDDSDRDLVITAFNQLDNV